MNLFARTIIALMLNDDAERLLDVQSAEHTGRMRKLRKAKREGSLADHGFFTSKPICGGSI